jgi:amino acid permease
MILFNLWHLSLLVCLVLFLITIANYATGKFNYKKLLQRNLIIVVSFLVISFTVIPNVPFFASYNYSENTEFIATNENGSSESKSAFKVFEILKSIINRFQ